MKKYKTVNNSIVEVVKVPGHNSPGIAKVIKGGNNYPGYLTVKVNQHYVINNYGDAITTFSEKPIPDNVSASDYASFKGLCFNLEKIS